MKRCLAAPALLEMLEEEDNRVTKRGKTRHRIKRRGQNGYFDNSDSFSRNINSNSAIPPTGETYRFLSFQFRISRGAIAYIVDEVCKAIVKYLGQSLHHTTISHRPECYCLSRHALVVPSFSMRGIIMA